jgi:hypothetical protein
MIGGVALTMAFPKLLKITSGRKLLRLGSRRLALRVSGMRLQVKVLSCSFDWKEFLNRPCHNAAKESFRNADFLSEAIHEAGCVQFPIALSRFSLR